MANSLTLTQLWNAATAIYKEGGLVFLKLEQEAMPVSFVDAPVWLAARDRLKDGPGWSIGINLAYLHKVSLADRTAAHALRQKIEAIPTHQPRFTVQVDRDNSEDVHVMPTWHSLPPKEFPVTPMLP